MSDRSCSHHRPSFIDVARIKALQALAKQDLTILPGIELVLISVEEKVHLIGIFPEYCDVQDVWTTLSGRLGLTPSDLKRKAATSRSTLNSRTLQK